MNEMNFTFEQSPWELLLENLRDGSTVSAARLLNTLEGEDEEALEEALQELERRHIGLDVSQLNAAGLSGSAKVRLEREQKLLAEGKLMQELEKDDPLWIYLDEIARVPAAGDPVLLSQLAAQGDETAQTNLVNVCLHRVISLAEEYVGKGVLLLDLYQEGSLGLWQAILNYDGIGDFEGECDWWIRQSMAKAVTCQARAVGTGSKMRQALEDYQAADKALLTRLGRNPTLEEIALELNQTPEDTALLEKMLADVRTAAKAKAAQEPKTEDPDDDKHVEDTAYFQMRQRIMELLSGLSDRDAEILTLRYGLEGGLPMSAQETGAKLGLTSEEVVSREAAALAQLRNER